VHEELMGSKFKSRTISVHYLAYIFILKVLSGAGRWWAPWGTCVLVHCTTCTIWMGVTSFRDCQRPF